MTEYDIGAAFEAIEDELISSMIQNMKRHRVEEADNEKQWEMWQAKQLESLEEYKRKNRKKYKGTFTDINDSIDKVIRKAYQEGGMEQEIEILKSIKKKYGDNVPNRVKRIRDSILSKTPFGSKAKRDYFQVNDKKLDALIHATTSDMTKAESAMLRMADDQYRKIIFKAQVYANSGAGTYEQAVDMATKDFLSAGINCIEYKNGRRVNIKSYARMAIQTADKRAALYADGELRKKLGISTVITKKRMNACPKCLPFVDKILIDDVWSGGKPEDGPYPLLSKALEAGFLHPNCKDHISTYIPGITEPPEGSLTKDEVKKVEKAAEQEAKQKYAERQAEKFERLAKHSLDDEYREKNQQKAKGWKQQAKVEELTLEEEGAIIRYISPSSITLNDKLRTGEELTNFEKEWIMNLNKALDKLPEYKGDLNRSLDFPDSELAQEFFDNLKAEEEFPQYISATKAGIYNPDGQVQIYIQDSKTGKDLKGLNDMENEVLYPINTKFRVVNKVKHGDKFYILLEEVE